MSSHRRACRRGVCLYVSQSILTYTVLIFHVTLYRFVYISGKLSTGKAAGADEALVCDGGAFVMLLGLLLRTWMDA